MRKFLAAGAIASVALSSANAECVNGGFYVQGSFGMSMTKMKYKNDLEPQYRVLKKGFLAIPEHFKAISSADVRNAGGQQQALNALAGNPNAYNAIPGYEACVFLKDIRNDICYMDATETSVQKRKGMFQFELGFGVDKRLGDAMIGIDVNFGKNFGNIKKKVKGLAYKKYDNLESAYAAAMQGTINSSGVLTANNNLYGVLFITKAAQGIAGDVTDINNALALGAPLQQQVLDLFKDYTILDVKRLANLSLCDPDFELEFKCKNKFYVSIMPRIGMLLNPRTELYATFGMKIKGDKYTVRAVEANESGNKSVTKCIPSFGLGLRHTFKSGVFVKLEYNMNLKASKTFKKLKIGDTVIDETTKHTLKNSSHDIKLGFGRKF